ncbi:MAG: hypothetical protein KDC53_13080, partial [Saprospiraceae bacterium]|nr:hypothetical protein [Saprospiraceae bacterium]
VVTVISCALFIFFYVQPLAEPDLSKDRTNELKGGTKIILQGSAPEELKLNSTDKVLPLTSSNASSISKKRVSREITKMAVRNYSDRRPDSSLSLGNLTSLEKSGNNPSLYMNRSDMGEEENSLVEKMSIHLLEFLPGRDFSLSILHEIKPGTGSDLLDMPKKNNEKRLAWAGSILIDPAASSVSPVRGLVFGLTYEQFIKRGLFVGLRPSLQLRSGDGGFSKFQQITTYGFGAENSTYALKANNLQFLTLPVYLGFEKKRHSLESGISLDILLAARGQLQQVAVEDQSVINLQSLNSGWINTDHMQRLSSNLFLGYKYLITSKIKTGVTLYYNPFKIYPGLPNSQSQRINSKWFFGWQATYYIK